MGSKKSDKRKAQKAGLLKVNIRGQRDPFTNSPATRERIKTGAILNRVERIALGQLTKFNPASLKAAEILLKKTLPDLSATHDTTGKEKTFEEWLDEIERARSNRESD